MNKSCAAILAVMFAVIVGSMAWMVCLNACGATGWTCPPKRTASKPIPAERIPTAFKVTV